MPASCVASGAPQTLLRRSPCARRVRCQALRDRSSSARDEAHLNSALSGLSRERVVGFVAGAALSLLCLGSSSPASIAANDPAKEGTLNDPNRCEISALDKFASMRASFSAEAGSGQVNEILVDVSGCTNFAGKDVSGKVLSGINMEDASFKGAKLVGCEMSRTKANRADLSGADLTDVNAYGATFDGADLRGVSFENAILSGATFGKDRQSGQWANMEGAQFEGALLSSSDVQRVCLNPTLTKEQRKYELGCRN